MEKIAIENKLSCSTQGMFAEPNTVAGSEENRTEPEAERSRLTQLEEIIDRQERSDAHLAIGKALKEINENRLYRAAGFRAFGRYTKKRFGYEKTFAYRLINYAKEVEKCVANGTTPPENEGSFRAAKVKEKRASRKQSKPAKLEPSESKPEPSGPELTFRVVRDIDEELDRFQETAEQWKAELSPNDYLNLLEQVKDCIDYKLEEADRTAESNLVVAFEEAAV